MSEDVDALVAAAAAQAGVGNAAAPASSDGYESSTGGIGEAVESPQPTETAPPPPEPMTPEPRQAEETMILGVPDREEPAAPAPAAGPPVEGAEDAERVPLAVLLRERDSRQRAQQQLEQLQAQAAELHRWRQENEPLLDEARRLWPELSQQASQVPTLQQEAERQKALAQFYRGHLAKAKEEYGLDFDEQAFMRDLQLQQALSRIENLDSTINAALAHQFNEREATYAQQQRLEAQQRQEAEARQYWENQFETQFNELTQAAPGIKNFRNALRTEFYANPQAPLKQTAAPMIQALAARQAATAQQAANMVRTQGASSASKPTVGGPQSPADRFKGMGVRDIIAHRKAELRRAGLA